MAEPLFAKVPTTLDFPKEEAEILELWRSARVFQRSLEGREGAPTFVFYEGPPTANGLPHNGHVLTRVMKDLYPRYKTMRGYRVPRKAGWDTHGLPVEVEVEKELRIHGKAAIEEYGVEPFAKRCIESVFRYTDQWEKLTERIGFWLDLKTGYVTYHKEYVESVWWALSRLFEEGLLYRGHKVVWWWAQGGTALSSGEVGQGYKTVDDPSVYVAFPLTDGSGRELLVWTTTPWTLPSNMYAAVNPKLEYVEIAAKGKRLVVAKGLVPALEKKLGEVTVGPAIPVAELVGKEYVPPFDLYTEKHTWRIIEADFVTLDAGTGIVHIAPAFGEDDFVAHRKFAGPTAPLLCAVAPDGTFAPELAKYAGRWVKDCDKDIAHELKERGVLLHAETYRHEYPFCWRADNDPLIQFARPAWYIKTTSRIDQAIANNQTVSWLPDHIKSGRFGDFLANNVDWALSRERYWGTPLNVWVCQSCGKEVAPDSVARLRELGGDFSFWEAAKAKDPSLSEHLAVHKPWIDEVTFPCAAAGCGGTMKRVPEVIDCWFDSGCMPFAQWGFPHAPGSREKLAESFPADFISEAIDQTRGWFYSLLMISTLVFDADTQKRYGLSPARAFPHPFKTCIVLGHVCDKEGKKESKSKGNYTPPEIILDDVAMDFAVLAASADGKVAAEAGVALVAREDLEGMDLQDGARVVLVQGERSREVAIKAAKHLPRRVAVLHASDREALGVVPTEKANVRPVEVPGLPAKEKVTVRDPASPAPGADAFRWFFYAQSPPWSNTRHSLSNVRALQKETLVKLRNVYSFFCIYAGIDAFDATLARTDVKARPELDRWILSELALTTQGVTRDMDAYDVYTATQKITAFVDALSNWYLRRSRARFWRSGWDDDKRAAFETLYECLVELTLVMAPFVPFQAEAMWQNLTRVARAAGKAKDSVHLEAWPTANEPHVDRALSRKMSAVRDVVSLGLQVRTSQKIKVRQPLRTAHVIVADRAQEDALAASAEMIADELNVLEVAFVPRADVEKFVSYKLKPNFRTLGQRGLGKQAQDLKKAFAALGAHDAASMVAEVLDQGKTSHAGVELVREDLEIAFETKDGFAAAGDRVGVVVLDTRLDDELRDLGFVRELLNRVQTARKDQGLEYSDRVRVAVKGSARVEALVEKHRELIAGECLAVAVATGAAPGGKDVEVEGESLSLAVAREG